MKINLGPKNCLFPMPVVLLGAQVNGRPNYMTVAWDGIMDFDLVSVALARGRYTYAGIKASRTFSLNLPSQAMLALTDYCGLVSGKNVDKSRLFQNFYGQLGTAPMIAECPLTMECRLTQIIEGLPTHDVLIGEVIAAHGDEACLTDGKIDWAKVQPILFTGTDAGYWSLGAPLGQMGRAGAALKRG